MQGGEDGSQRSHVGRHVGHYVRMYFVIARAARFGGKKVPRPTRCGRPPWLRPVWKVYNITGIHDGWLC
jgi:hypothetical protein